jgi:DNA-binding winged helix-turn-helix (wHTH) protein
MITPPDDGLIRIDESAYQAWKGDRPLQLSLKMFRILAMLVTHAGTVVTREDLMREVWQTTWMSSSKTIDMHVSWLRRALHDNPARPRYVTTVRGVGFRLEADAVPEPELLKLVTDDHRLPLHIEHGQMVYDAGGALVAVALTSMAAQWIVECANETAVDAERLASLA